MKPYQIVIAACTILALAACLPTTGGSPSGPGYVGGGTGNASAGINSTNDTADLANQLDKVMSESSELQTEIASLSQTEAGNNRQLQAQSSQRRELESRLQVLRGQREYLESKIAVKRKEMGL